MRRLLIAAVTLVLLLTAMPTAAAEPDVMVRVTGIHLIAKGAVVNVDTEYRCTWLTAPDPPDEAYFEETYVDVRFQQTVSGRQLAWGQEATGFEGDPTCDGTWHPLLVQVEADRTLGQAFKTGVAAMNVVMKASYGWYREYEGMGWYQYAFFDREYVIDWHQVKLAK